MEIKITDFFNADNACNFSASRMELGDDAGSITWQNALDHEPPMLTDADELQAMRDWAKGSGGWNAGEIAAWTDNELNALFVQLVSGDMHEASLSPGMTEEEWAQYEDDSQAGRVAGNIFRAADNLEIYYYLGS